jgi:hypothetical protein
VVQAAARTDNYYGGSFMLNYGTEKFNVFTTLFPSYFKTNIDGYSNTVTHGTGTLNENMHSENRYFSENFKLGFDLDVTKNDLFTVFWSQQYSEGDNTNRFVSVSNRINPPETSTVNTIGKSGYSHIRNTLSLNYKHLFKKKGTELSFDFIHSSPEEDNNSHKEYRITDENGILLMAPYNLFPKDISNYSYFESNFTAVLSEKINLNMDAGVNLTLNRAKEDYSGATLVNGSWKDSVSIRNSFATNEFSPSAYLLFDFGIKKFEFNIGQGLNITVSNRV